MSTITAPASGSPEAKQSSKRPIAKLPDTSGKKLSQAKKPKHELAPATPLPPSPEFPDEVITNILSFLPIISINKEFSKSLLKIYKETIVKRLSVGQEIVEALKNSDVVHIFQKLNELNPKLTATAIDMGFSLKQIATIPVDQLSEYITQYDDYVIPNDIKIQIDHLSVNGELNLNFINLTTGQLCKILNALTDDQRNALKFLYLSYNHLTSLPDSIGGLSNLMKLYLSSNQLTSLPDSIGYLSKLTRLSISKNQLTSLPDSIGYLGKLTRLSIYNNQLTFLPDSIGYLSALRFLDLSNNQLTSLPDSIGGLSNLTELILRGNNFDDDFKPAIKQQFPFAEL